VVTPHMHKVHHSDQQPETDSNFATVLSVWDRLAGTFRMRADPSTIVFGLRKSPPRRGRGGGECGNCPSPARPGSRHPSNQCLPNRAPCSRGSLRSPAAVDTSNSFRTRPPRSSAPRTRSSRYHKGMVRPAADAREVLPWISSS
jgi:hypothetical protein